MLVNNAKAQFIQIGPISVKSSNEQIEVVPNVAHTLKINQKPNELHKEYSYMY